MARSTRSSNSQRRSRNSRRARFRRASTRRRSWKRRSTTYRRRASRPARNSEQPGTPVERSASAEGCLLQLAVVQQPRLLPRELTVAEQREVRNAPHVVALREIAVRFGIDFQNDGAAGEIRGGFCDLGSRHFAWPTPRRPEIDQHRNARAARDLVELPDVDVERLVQRRQRLPARAATAAAGEMSRWNAVGGSTRGTVSNHDGLSISGGALHNAGMIQEGKAASMAALTKMQ